MQSDMQIIIKKVCSEAFLCIWRVGYHAALVEGCQFSVGLNGKYACKRVSASWAEGCMEWKKHLPRQMLFVNYIDNNDTVSYGFKRFHLKMKPSSLK